LLSELSLINCGLDSQNSLGRFEFLRLFMENTHLFDLFDDRFDILNIIIIIIIIVSITSFIPVPVVLLRYRTRASTRERASQTPTYISHTYKSSVCKCGLKVGVSQHNIYWFLLYCSQQSCQQFQTYERTSQRETNVVILPFATQGAVLPQRYIPQWSSNNEV